KSQAYAYARESAVLQRLPTEFEYPPCWIVRTRAMTREILLFQPKCVGSADAGKAHPPDLRGQRLLKGPPRAVRDTRRHRTLPHQHREDRRLHQQLEQPPDRARAARLDRHAPAPLRRDLLGREARFLRFLSAQPRARERRPRDRSSEGEAMGVPRQLRRLR